MRWQMAVVRRIRYSPALRPMTPGGTARSSVLAGTLALALVVMLAAAPQGRGLDSLRPGPAIGVQFHCTWNHYTDAERRTVAARLAAAGVKSVRIDLGWSSFQPHRRRHIDRWYTRLADRCVNLARAQGMEVLATILWTPNWANGGRGATTPPRRVSDFARFARWAARHFRGRVAAWEIWNEPEGANFWRGTPARYVRMLRAAYPAIKAGDANAKVVFAGNSDDSPGWLAAAYRAGAKGAFDVMATHPYRGDGPPDAVGSDAWLLVHGSRLHSVMARHGDSAKPIWVTEFGWSAHDNPPGTPSFRRGVTLEQQAQYLVRAVAVMRLRYPYVEKAFWYKDATRPADDRHHAGYGLLRADLSPRPVYSALRSLLAG
jgi:hypothetical protein